VTGGGRLVSRGIRLGGQSVLLAGVNDRTSVLLELFTRQAAAGITPYYLFHLDPAPGTAHFRVSLLRGKALLASVHRRNPRLPLPVYAIDLPNGGGKVPVESLRIKKGEGNTLIIQTATGAAISIPE
jgi:lysine 2,3-aminomutase